MIQIESPLFSKLTREKSLPHPTARNFRAELWVQAVSLITATQRDNELLGAALRYGLELSLLRSTFEEKIFTGLSKRQAILLTVAMANYNYIIFSKRARDQVRGERRKVTYLGAIGRQPVPNDYPGNEGSADTMVGTIVDTLPHCLERTNNLDPIESDHKVDFFQRGSLLFSVLSIEHNLRDLWQQVLWEGWCVKRENNQLRHLPKDVELEVKWTAWHVRQETILIQNPLRDTIDRRDILHSRADVPAILDPTVVGIRGNSRDSRTFKIGSVSGKLHSQVWHATEAAMLEDCYLAPFIDATLPRLGRKLSCRDLQRAWCVLRDAAQVLVQRNQSSRPTELYAVEQHALLIGRSELEKAFVHCARLTEEQAKLAFDFFLCDPNNPSRMFSKGLWASPILAVDDSATVALVWPAIAVGSTIRRIESWLDSGGLSDQLSDARRGLRYETWVRQELSAAMQENEFLAENGAVGFCEGKANDDEQIDLIICFGDLLLVGEIKCLLAPVESIERYNYLLKLNEAGEQATRKAKWLQEHPEIAARALRKSSEKIRSLRSIPIVVINQGAGFGLLAGGVRIIDFHFLSLFLRDSHYVAGMAVQFSTGMQILDREILYRSEQEASASFEAIMANPPPLKRFVDGAVWKDNKFPMSDGKDLSISVCHVGNEMGERGDLMAKLLR